jgi:hypothetical protein
MALIKRTNRLNILMKNTPNIPSLSLKGIIGACALLLLSNSASFAQCDKNVILASSKTEYLDGQNVLQRTVEENSTVLIGDSKVIITPGSGDRKMVGVIRSNDCDWKVPFKEGKSTIKAVFSEDNGEKRNVTLTIEGKDGRVAMLMEIKETPDRKIRIPIIEFKEQK